MIVEVVDNKTLSWGMQSFGICFAKQVNRWVSELGANQNSLVRFANKKLRQVKADKVSFLSGRQISANYRLVRSNLKHVFVGRYHLHILKTPTEVKKAIKYVLMNASKHFKRPEFVDPYSSAVGFKEWSGLLGELKAKALNIPSWFGKVNLVGIGEAETWLLKTGWLRGL